MTYTECPCCSGAPRGFAKRCRSGATVLINICSRCGAEFGDITVADLAELIPDQRLVPGEAVQYFDYTFSDPLMDGGKSRVHGWLDESDRVVQYG